MALTALGLLFASACGQGDNDTTTEGATPAAEAEPTASRRAAKSTASPSQEDGETTTTTAPEDGDAAAPVEAEEVPVEAEETTGTTRPDQPADEDEATEVCGDAGPDIAPLRGRPQDAPAECIELGTGDVQVTLRWASPADIDLHVTEPDGTEIWYGDTGPTSTGGELDVDSNVGCQQEASVENIFWPTGQAPSGTYTIEVNGFQVDDCGSGDYTVTAQVRGEEVLVESGSVGEDETDTYEIEV
jgi:uncharacterized protein YfaP (DUF2135 family)